VAETLEIPTSAGRGRSVARPIRSRCRARSGHQNLTKLHIAAAIEKARAKRAERCEVTVDWVFDELRKIAGANMADYLKSTTHGDPYRDFFGTDA